MAHNHLLSGLGGNLMAAAIKLPPKPESKWLCAMFNDKMRCNFITNLMTLFLSVNKSHA